MSIRLLHKKSSVPKKTPLAKDLLYGELAINYAASGETFSIKNSENEVVTFPMYKIEKMSEDLSVLSGSVSANATSITNEVTRATKSEKEIQNTITTISNNLSTVSGSLYTFLESNKIDDTVDTLKEIQEFIENNGTADIIKDINTINENIANISGDTVTNTQDILTLQTTISSVSGVIKTDIDALSGSVSGNSVEIANLNGLVNTVSGKVDTNITNIEAVSGSVSANTSAITRLKGEGNANPHIEPFKKLTFENINDILPYFQNIITNYGLGIVTYNGHMGEYRVFIGSYMYNVKFAVDMNNYTATITVSGTLDIDDEELVISPNYAIAECQCVYDKNEKTQEWGDWKIVASSDFQEQIINNQTTITQINSDIQIVNNNITSISGAIDTFIDDINDYHQNMDNDINTINDNISTISGSVIANTSAIENLQNIISDLTNRLTILEMSTYILNAQGSYNNDELTIETISGMEINVDDFNNIYDSNNEMLQ